MSRFGRKRDQPPTQKLADMWARNKLRHTITQLYPPLTFLAIHSDQVSMETKKLAADLKKSLDQDLKRLAP
jgi:hypothetical protein